jgi:hypothetical protein
MSRGGVYVIRARKPAARFRIPLLSWHFAYVGESNSIALRIAQHFVGGGQFQVQPKCWADRSPYVWARIPLPRWKWLLRSVETLVILLLWPVYNDRKNRWNPRRVSLRDQRWQRSMRDAAGWCVNWTYGHTAVVLAVVILAWRWLA